MYSSLGFFALNVPGLIFHTHTHIYIHIQNVFLKQEKRLKPLPLWLTSSSCTQTNNFLKLHLARSKCYGIWYCVFVYACVWMLVGTYICMSVYIYENTKDKSWHIEQSRRILSVNAVLIIYTCLFSLGIE